MTKDLRERATAVVIRNGRVLLVRGRGRAEEFMMPGGGIDPGETPMSAAVRELHEETALAATRIEPLFVWESAIQRHHAFRVETAGEVEMGPEIGEFIWWDRRDCVPTFPHVEAILERL